MKGTELEALRSRVGRIHLAQRLGIQREHLDQVLGQGRTLFHPENWYSAHGLIRAALRLTGLAGRGRANAAAVEVVRNGVAIPGLPGPFEGFTILHLSDLHLDLDSRIASAIAGRVASLDCDLCVLTGDYRAATHGPVEPALEAMRALASRIRAPAYAVLGNHDWIEMAPGLEAAGIRVLLNESETIVRDGAALHLAGIDDPHFYELDNIEKAAAALPPDEPAVLLSHSPEVYRRAAHAGFDLMLCGHTHGGQICLPGGRALTYNARCPRRLGRGAWRHGGMTGYTSRGAGSCIVAARFHCPPEITLHRLTRAAADTQ